MNRSKLLFATALAAAPLLAAAPASAQSVEDIMNTAIEKYEQRMAGIDNYTVVQQTLGTTVTTYYEKKIVDGKPVFVSSTVSIAGQERPSPATGEFADIRQFADHATYEGREDVDGHSTYAIKVDKEALDAWRDALSAGAQGGFEMQSMTMYMDARDYVPRRIVVDGTMSQNGQSRQVTSTINLEDYRNIDGLLHPFRTTFSIEGIIGEGEGPSEEEIANAREQLANFEKQLAEMPESQRAMVERMMGDRMKQVRELLESGGTKFTLEVQDVQVNQGPPSKEMGG